jgi:hypothetical protein
MSVGKMSRSQITINQMSIGQISFGQMSVSKMFFGQKSGNQSNNQRRLMIMAFKKWAEMTNPVQHLKLWRNKLERLKPSSISCLG